MSSIVLDLQNDLLNPDCDILCALRKAHVIASKLNLSEFDEWVQKELNGYSDRSDIPDYRVVCGAAKGFNPYRGWIPLFFQDPNTEELFCKQKLDNPVGELIQLCNSNKDVIFHYNGFTQSEITKHTNTQYDYALHVGVSGIKSIIELVKNSLLEWTLRLESNEILGENMKFSKSETAAAQSIPQTINNYYGNVVSGNISKSQFASDNATINVSFDSGINIAEIDNLIKAITDNLCGFDKGNTETLIDSIEMIREELTKPQPKGRTVSNGIKLLAPMVAIANGIPVLATNIQNFIEYITPIIQQLT